MVEFFVVTVLVFVLSHRDIDDRLQEVGYDPQLLVILFVDPAETIMAFEEVVGLGAGDNGKGESYLHAPTTY